MVDAGYPDRAKPVVNYFQDNFILVDQTEIQYFH